jgi:hypothetical protein
MKIDDQTWNDLLLDAYCERIAAPASLFGREALRHRLRHGAVAKTPDVTGAAGAPDLAPTRERIQTLLSDAALTASVSAACRPLSACDTTVVPLLGAAGPESDAAQPGAQRALPRWSGHLWLLPIAFLLSAVFALFWWPLWAVTLTCWLLLMALQVTYHSRIQTWQAVVHSLQAILRSHVGLGAIPSPLLDDFRPQAAAATKLSRQLARTVLARAPVASEYLDWVLLDNLKHYFRTQRLVAAHIATLRHSHELVAVMDAELALSAHLREAPTVCWAGTGAHITLRHVIHPMLDIPQALTIDLQGGAFISGQNGTGKSTLLRTIGINLLTARAFGFCYAEEASVPMLAVCASMKSEDALEQGESLYLAELRRAREMLALSNSGQRTVFLIDEIFRGTNHLESVSAGAAVLHALAENDIVLVSSHNLVLGTLLEDRLEALCVQSDDDGKLRLAPGILRQTNGIALLRHGGFDPAIEARAQQVYAQLVDMVPQ